MKKIRLSKTATVLLAAAAMFLCDGRVATAFSVGWDTNLDPSRETTDRYRRVVDGWSVGPHPVTFAAESGPWLQNLLLPTPERRPKSFDGTFTLIESLRVGKTGWSVGWQQEIKTAGWVWGEAILHVFDNDFGHSKEIIGNVSDDKLKISFDFAERLDPGSWLWVANTLCWTGQGPASGSLQVSSSFVPIPGAAWMLGSGLIGLVALRRRIRSFPKPARPLRAEEIATPF
jgi:hypothetical protein